MKLEKKRSLGRKLYIIEAAVEYLISILVTGSFLAALTRELGFSDGLTGILSAITSFGCLFQLLSIPLRVKHCKSFVIGASILNQLLFLFLFLLPFLPYSDALRTFLFIAAIFVAYFVYYLAHPKKITWMMTNVDENRRGTYTALKEAISLVVGMIFSYGMGWVTDTFAERGEIRTAFLISAAAILLFSVIHTLSMGFTYEPKELSAPGGSLRRRISETLRDKNLCIVILLFVLYQISNSVSRPFYGTYQINELGFSLQFISVLSIFSAIARIIASIFWGNYADRHSFLAMIEKCLIFLLFSDLCVIFAVPSNGMVLFSLYYVFHGIAQGGINSALINLVFDYVPLPRRSDSLAVCQAISGVIGFSVTLLASPLVDWIQQNDNTVFGIPLYAQQFLTIFSFLVLCTSLLYIHRVLSKKKADK